jgi:Icc-related predicted phosphoesterase
MKIQVLSDLHLEFIPFQPLITDADVVVLAGDIHLGTEGLQWAKEIFTDKIVIYVLGNHEYYYHTTPTLIHQLRQLAIHSQVHVLENESIEIEGVKFFGCTLWTDFKLWGNVEAAALNAQSIMTDYYRIKISPALRMLQASDTASFHAHSIKWLSHELKLAKTSSKKVVVTHHAPSSRSLPAIFRSDLIGAALVSPLDEFIEDFDIDVWVHGHVHKTLDYQIGKTRIVCNPRGYPRERLSTFNPDWVIEV